jgi:DNA polymerase-3 subunit epsilon
MGNRQVMLDTETTGLEYRQGHRIIEIGAVEVINREITGDHYHQYINPDREIDRGALEVHGITSDFLDDKPLFARIANEFIKYVEGAELVIHNAAFDVGFLNNELMLCGIDIRLEDICKITDTLDYARNKHPGAKNSLDALCKRYGISNEHRTLHGALLDSEILAEVYLAMTGGQTKLNLDTRSAADDARSMAFNLNDLPPLTVIKASDSELKDHINLLNKLSNNGENPFVYQIDDSKEKNELKIN